MTDDLVLRIPSGKKRRVTMSHQQEGQAMWQLIEQAPTGEVCNCNVEEDRIQLTERPAGRSEVEEAAEHD